MLYWSAIQRGLLAILIISVMAGLVVWALGK